MRRPIIAGNWKMYKSLAEALDLVENLKLSCSSVADRDVVVCPPFTALAIVSQSIKKSALKLGAQNLHWEKEGAYTGEVSAKMIVDAGCYYVIIGHSERRQYFGETDDTVNKRTKAALAAGLIPIVCVGETLAERESNRAFEVIERQMKGGLAGLSVEDSQKIVAAYEPVWAIGTGKTATPEQAQEIHAFIREKYSALYGGSAASGLRILYGGSVKPDNAANLMRQADIDGALVGGAALKADDFAKIVKY
ncbi:MAG: triose-phosphate isomerase [Elusimicrobia bacterium HGW-Elusimicrobia-1]|nr:MAG: triose-phosphate isomerase [Elusimicrobia bacterium HGW-Elusimicrobia-1]